MIARVHDHRQLAIRLGVVGGTLAGAGFLAPRATPLHLGLILGLAGLVAVLRSPALGLVILAAGSTTIPFTVGTGTETSINVAIMLVAVLTVVWWLDLLVGRRELRLAPSPTNAPLFTLLAVAVLAFIAGAQPWLSFAQTASVPAQAGGLALYVLSVLAFFLVANLARDVRWLQAMTWAFLGTAAVLVASIVVPGGSAFSQAMLGRTTLGSVFWIWVVALAFSQAAFNKDLGILPRLALGGLLLAAFYFLLGPSRSWTSGWLPAALVVPVVLIARSPRLAPLMLLGAAIGALAMAPAVIEFTMAGDNEYSLFTRVEAWRILAEIIAINPILGVGFSNYYWYTPLYPILGYAVSFNSHNNYLDILAQTGVLGMGCFFWFIGSLGWHAWRLRQEARPGFERAYVYGALGGLAAMVVSGMFGDWLLPFVYNIGYNGFRSSILGWLFLGGVVALAHIMAQDHTDTETVPVDRS